MSELVDVLYPLPDVRRTALSSLRWWESRRLTFNKAVGAAGLTTLAGTSLMLLVGPDTLGPGPGLGMLVLSAVYGVAANVCYSMGWVIESVARAIWGRQAPDVGPLLFRQGLIFSVGLTLLPLLIMTFVFMIHVGMAVFG